MARNGSGTFSLPQAPFVTNTTISSTATNSNNSDIAAALTQSISKDGQTAYTGNQPMGGNKLTGLGEGSAATDSVNISQLVSGVVNYSAAAGTDTITITPSPGITAYAIGQRFVIKIANTNTGAVTLNVNSVGAGAVTWPNGTALVAGDLVANAMVEVDVQATTPVFHLQTVVVPPVASTSPFFVQTGSVTAYIGATAPTGWLLLSGKTIGNAASSGTARANADTATLYAMLWDNFSDAICPVSTGRGASAAADFAANKTITLIDARGRVIAGPDAMGGTAANRLGSGATGGITGAATPGASGGEQSHAQTSAELATHTHTVPSQIQVGNDIGGGAVYAAGLVNAGPSGSAGSGTAANITQPTIALNYIIKM